MSEELPCFMLSDRLIQQLKSDSDVIAVFLFGSQVKGTARPYSDYDYCIITKTDITRKKRKELLSLSSKYVDMTVLSDLSPTIKFRVFKKGKPLFIKDKHYLRWVMIRTVKEYLDCKSMLERVARRVLA